MTGEQTTVEQEIIQENYPDSVQDCLHGYDFYQHGTLEVTYRCGHTACIADYFNSRYADKQFAEEKRQKYIKRLSNSLCPWALDMHKEAYIKIMVQYKGDWDDADAEGAMADAYNIVHAYAEMLNEHIADIDEQEEE